MQNEIHPVVAEVTQRIEQRSQALRDQYEERMQQAAERGTRQPLSCGNLAHAVAASPMQDKLQIVTEKADNLAIVTAYNDMLSAHQPFKDYPDMIKRAARENGCTAQVAGGVPAMCDGVTQGEPGMELSLFSRDVIALSASVSLSHGVFDAAVFLGVCDKIVPGLVIAAATFGYLPSIFLPAGPMTSGLSNDEKARCRQQYAAGEIDRAALLAAEMKSYHSPGTCTFYGTANSNQMLMEFMGLQLPGSSFINPGTPLRRRLTEAGTRQILSMTQRGDEYTPVYKILTAKAFVNGIVGLNATGGSTNLVIHLIAMARAAGIIITLDDFSDLSAATPLMAKVYPNSNADVNHFHAAGGLQFVIQQLLESGRLHNDVHTVAGFGLHHYCNEATLTIGGDVQWNLIGDSYDADILRSVSDAFQATGGLMRLQGNLGEALIKQSAVKQEYRVIRAPAKVFNHQDEVKQAYERGELTGDFVCVIRFQGPKANGMPELHSLMPILGRLQDNGQRVAILTDGRMSGASGKVPAAIHLSPEAQEGGVIGKLQDGDMIYLDADQGTLDVFNEHAEDDVLKREAVNVDLSENEYGQGRELFQLFRQFSGSSSTGASALFNVHGGE